MLDIATASVIQWFNGALNHRYEINFHIMIFHGHGRFGIPPVNGEKKILGTNAVSLERSHKEGYISHVEES
jgi:hypothetical protein